ncbi:MAG TPA: hypothetical protein PLX06_07785 [Fimbriimonadaceae bacterium]|nr:hypothetical protein [Fimbriimonadaceae bacterium]
MSRIAKRTPFRITIVSLALAVAASTGSVYGAAAAATGAQAKAREALFRTMERGHLVALSAIIVQKAGATCPSDMQFKVEQTANGQKKVTILQPLTMQGKISIDDGKNWYNYSPDENRIMIAPSPQLSREDPKERIELASQNYRFMLEKNGIIAGRETFVVTATPRYPELPVRRYSIDSEKDVLLRTETIDSGGRKSLHFDTQAITYFTDRQAPTSFSLKPVGNPRKIQVTGPQKIESPSWARARAGFAPILPRDLPFGFIVREPQLTGEDQARFIAVRITDGLLTATVYQWDPRRVMDPLGKDPGVLTRFVNGIRIGLVGEIPETIHGRLLDLFVKEAARAFRQDAEPSMASSLLKGASKPRSSGSKDSASEDDGSPREPSPTDFDSALMETLSSFLTALQSESALQ